MIANMAFDTDISLEDDFDSFELVQDQSDEESVTDTATSPSSTDPGLFDPSLLQSLIDSLPKDKFDDLLQSFLDKTDELVATLETAKAEAQGMETVYDRAHELKGMAANFGLTGVSAIAAEIEKSAKNKDSEAAYSGIASLGETNEKAQAALKVWAFSHS